MVTRSFAAHKNIPPTVAVRRKIRNSAFVIPDRRMYSVDKGIQRADDNVNIHRKAKVKPST
jgi:hypothetical protein